MPWLVKGSCAECSGDFTESNGRESVEGYIHRVIEGMEPCKRFDGEKGAWLFRVRHVTMEELEEMRKRGEVV